MTDCWYHAETILCPHCHLEQEAVVAHTYPFWTYSHTCTCCGYEIGESEWERVESGASAEADKKNILEDTNHE